MLGSLVMKTDMKKSLLNRVTKTLRVTQIWGNFFFFNPVFSTEQFIFH